MKNWHTTVLGLGAGGLNLLANGTNWKQVLLSLSLGALGAAAKSWNVTGGSVKQ